MDSEACLSAEQILDLWEDRLPEEDAAIYSRHLSECSACLERAEKLSAKDDPYWANFAKRLRRLEVPAWVDELVQSVRQKVRNGGGKSEPPLARQEPFQDEDIQRAERFARLLSALWLNTPNPNDGANALSTKSTVHGHDGNTQELRVTIEGSGEFLGRFQIQRLLGRGGMGSVFLAFDPTLQRQVALKIPRFDVAGAPDLRDRFLLEARSAAQFSHPNLVEVYDAGLDGAICYIASAYCDGPDLAKWLANHDKPIAPEFAARLMGKLAQAIQYCHERGIIHRDLKPANILLAPVGGNQGTEHEGMPFIPKITDFGLARMIEESLIQTQSSLIVGTPLYMAPEQADGRIDEVGPGTDIFALGVILYELLTGRLPFEGRTTLTLLSRIQREEPVSPRRVSPNVPAGLEAICMKALRKRPEERYLSAGDMAADLDNWLKGRKILARRYTVLDRFRTWRRQPERIRDAGIGIIALQCILTLWVVLGIALADKVYEGDALVQTRVQGGATVIFFCLPLIALAVSMLTGRRWTIPVALVICLFGQTFVPASILAGKVQMLEGYYDRQPYFETTNLGFVLFAGLIQTVLLGLALIASRADRFRW